MMKLFTLSSFTMTVAVATAAYSGNGGQRSLFRKRSGYFQVDQRDIKMDETRGLEGLLFDLEGDILSTMSLSLSMSMSMSYGPVAVTMEPTYSATPSLAPSLSPTAIKSGVTSAPVTSNAPSLAPSVPVSEAPSFPPSQNPDDDLVLTATRPADGTNRNVNPLTIGAVVAVGAAGIMGVGVWLVARRSREKNVAVVADMSLAPVSILSDDQSVIGGASV